MSEEILESPIPGPDSPAGILAAEVAEANAKIEGKAGVDIANPPLATKVKFAGKEFASNVEAEQYAVQLEREKIDAEAYARGMKEQMSRNLPSAVATVAPDEFAGLEDEFFKDPAGTLKKVSKRTTEKATEIATQMYRQEMNRQQQWNKFYVDNPDLAPWKDDVVNQVLAEKGSAWSSLTWDEGAKNLAVEARSKIASIKGRLQNVTPLRSGAAVVADSTAAVSSGRAPTVATKPLDFVTQLNQAKTKAKARN